MCSCVLGALMLSVFLFGLASVSQLDRAEHGVLPQQDDDRDMPLECGRRRNRVSRFLADALKQQLGAPCVVQNKTGGSGAVGHSFGANARPDGYTLTMGTFELTPCTGWGSPI